MNPETTSKQPEASPPSGGAAPKPLPPQVRQSISDLRGRRSNLRGVFELGSTYLFIALCFWAIQRPAHWILYPVAFLWIGMMQYRLVMSSHEAVHKTLLSPVWLNEAFGSINAALVGISFFNYRKTHLDHHKSPQYIRDDSDAYIYKPLLQTRPGLPRLTLLLFGVWIDVYVKLRRKITGIRPEEQKSAAANASDSQLWLIVLLQLGLLAGCALSSAWWFYFVFWFAPIFCVALTLDRIRTFVEHSYYFIFTETETRVDHALQATVDIQTNAVEAYFLAPFGFDYHQAHHAQLTVPFYNLRELSDLLLVHDARYNDRVKGSYLVILTRMIWASK